MNERNLNIEVDVKEPLDGERYVWGWHSVEEAAADLYSSLHRDLLNGRPLFLYKNTTSGKSDLIQVVVVESTKNPNDYALGVVTTGYSYLYPHVGKDYLISELIVDLTKWKIDKKIIEEYTKIVNK
jgi:hypothetical protein